MCSEKRHPYREKALVVNYGERLFHNQRPRGRKSRYLDVRYRMNHTTKGLTLTRHYHPWLSP